MEHQNTNDNDNALNNNAHDGGLEQMSGGLSASQIGSMLSSPLDNLKPTEILALQRSHGNQFVQRLMMQRSATSPNSDKPFRSLKMVTPTEWGIVAESEEPRIDTQAKSPLQRYVPNPNDLPGAPTDVAPSTTFDFITIKLLGYGVDHWWIEIDDSESYGWWPVEEADNEFTAPFTHGIWGVPGELNAVSRPHLGGSATRDPHHGDSAPESFHPYAISSTANLDDDVIRQRIRNFASSFSGDYRVLGSPNCHTFIQSMMRSVGLSQGRTAGNAVVPEWRP